jgi:hypothetical protein
MSTTLTLSLAYGIFHYFHSDYGGAIHGNFHYFKPMSGVWNFPMFASGAWRFLEVANGVSVPVLSMRLQVQ